MPVPQEYQIATQEFERFLDQAKDALDLSTRNQAYTTVQAVLTVFRRRLRPNEILHFAGVLPAGQRALFVNDWSEDEYKKEFGNAGELAEEVKSLRRDHNFSPDNAINAVTGTIRDCVDEAQLDRVLATISQEAQAFWRSGNDSGRFGKP